MKLFIIDEARAGVTYRRKVPREVGNFVQQNRQAVDISKFECF